MRGRSYNRFPQIIAELEPKVEAAVEVGRHMVADEARARVHVDSGSLRDAIHVDDKLVVAGDNDAFHGHFEEFGTTRNPAHPFLVPALEAKTEDIVGLVVASLRGL